jgi:8-oxo-dGTP diphosphatase
VKPFDTQQMIQQLSIDCVIFGYQSQAIKVLIPRLDLPDECWALPGGFIHQNEGIDHAAQRILKERTGLTDIYLEQFRVFGGADRINLALQDHLKTADRDKLAHLGISEVHVQWLAQRFVSIGYYALVDIDKVKPQKSTIDASVDWYPIKNLPTMIMDHHTIIEEALKTLRAHLDERLLGFNLLPDTFTMKELQELYEAVYDTPFARNNFQKKILDLGVLERLEKKFTGAANKAPYLYRFKQ